jgi:hypothetical protein
VINTSNDFVDNNFMACPRRRRIVVFCQQQLTNLCKQEGTSDAPSEEEFMNVNIRKVFGLSLVKFCHEIYGSLVHLRWCGENKCYSCLKTVG